MTTAAYRATHRTELAAAARRRRAANREHHLAIERKSREGRRDKANAATQTWRKNNPRRKKDSYLRTIYGVSLFLFESMLYAQGSRCAVCDRPFEGTFRAYLDHDHETHAVRGLLCLNCNTAIGQLGESAERLEQAAAYVRSYAGKDWV